MGYQTDLIGEFDISPPLTAEQVKELREFSETAHDDPEMPGTWCQWIPDEDGESLAWDQVEKFYSYVLWLEYLIERFFKPWGRVLNGDVAWVGSEFGDSGTIYVKDNRIQAIQDEIVSPEPKWD